MLFGGSDAPCANALMVSIGKISLEENDKHAAAIYPVVSKYLGVTDDRMYIVFHDAGASNLAWKSATFQTILGK